jgi:DHA1 family bicyclomycin/chloramphenicol resistance-like MFS transporter
MRGCSRTGHFIGASVVCGFSSSGTFAYIASAPFVFIVLYKVPTERFGWLFGSVALGMVAAAQINGRMPRRIPLWRVLRTANLVQLCAGMLLLASVLSGVGGMWASSPASSFMSPRRGSCFPTDRPSP